MLQNRFAASVGAFVEFCSSPLFGARANPSDKIVKNLCAFLCQDAKETPIFSTTSAKPGIISLQEMTPKVTAKGNVKEELYESDEVIQAKVTRRGARLALSSLARRFGSNAFTAAPKLWEGMSGALLRTFPPGQSSACVLRSANPSQARMSAKLMSSCVAPTRSVKMWLIALPYSRHSWPTSLPSFILE